MFPMYSYLADNYNLQGCSWVIRGWTFGLHHSAHSYLFSFLLYRYSLHRGLSCVSLSHGNSYNLVCIWYIKKNYVYSDVISSYLSSIWAHLRRLEGCSWVLGKWTIIVGGGDSGFYNDISSFVYLHDAFHAQV